MVSAVHSRLTFVDVLACRTAYFVMVEIIFLVKQLNISGLVSIVVNPEHVNCGERF